MADVIWEVKLNSAYRALAELQHKFGAPEAYTPGLTEQFAKLEEAQSLYVTDMIERVLHVVLLLKQGFDSVKNDPSYRIAETVFGDFFTSNYLSDQEFVHYEVERISQIFCQLRIGNEAQQSSFCILIRGSHEVRPGEILLTINASPHLIRLFAELFFWEFPPAEDAEIEESYGFYKFAVHLAR